MKVLFFISGLTFLILALCFRKIDENIDATIFAIISIILIMEANKNE